MNIPIGLCLSAEEIMDTGFPAGLPVSSWSIMFWHQAEMEDLLKVRQIWQEQDSPLPVSTLSLYGDPLSPDERGETCRRGWENIINESRHFGTDLVTGFTGRIRHRPVEDSFEPFKTVFGRLGSMALDQGVRIAFENCRMRGSWHSGAWNLAFTPGLWEILFDLLGMEHFGLEWDPGHLTEMMIDPVANLDAWKHRVFHVHGKDCLLNRSYIRREGVYSKNEPGEFTYPGKGETDWKALLDLLDSSGYSGVLSVEDPRYGHPDRAGQVESISYLRSVQDV